MTVSSFEQLIDAAQQFMSSGRLDLAAETCRKILAVDAAQGDALHLLGIIRAQGGHLTEAIELLEKAVLYLPEDPDARSNLAHMLRQTQQLEQAAQRYTEAIALRPDFPEALVGLGQISRLLGRAQTALDSFSSAIQLGHGSAEVYFARGVLLADAGEFELAMADLDQCIALSPTSPEPRSSRAAILSKWGFTQSAEAEHRRALSLNPNFVDGYCNFADFLLTAGRYDEALVQARKAVELQPGFAEAHWNASLALLHLGQYSEGWSEYEWRWECLAFRGLHPQRFPWAQPLPTTGLHGKSILVFSEQGYGDTIQFARYLLLLRAEGALVTFLAFDRVSALFSCLEADGIEVVAALEAGRQFDFSIPLMSLPRRYSTSADDIPYAKSAYLKPVVDKSKILDKLPVKSKKQRIGLMWRGGDHGKLHPRSVPLALLSELVSEHFEWIGLPLEVGVDEEYLLKWFPEMYCPLTEQKNFLDTASIIATCDLVISVDTSVAHLAGAMGIPTWVMLPRWSDWRWSLDTNRSRWYQSVGLIRQKTAGEWRDVIETIKSRLRSEAGIAYAD